MKSLLPFKRKPHSAAPAVGTAAWIDDLWHAPWNDRWFNGKAGPSLGVPAVDLTEDRKNVVVRTEVPGLDVKDLEVTWHNGVLRIQGEKKSETEGRKNGGRFRECRYGRFSRDIPVGAGADWKNAKAVCRNGVLTVTMPKTGTSSAALEIKVS